MKEYATGSDLGELITRVLCDDLPKWADGVVLYGQTVDNESSVLLAGADLYKVGKVSKVMVREEKGTGYPGADRWVERLCKSGVVREAIERVEVGEPFNTYTEAVAFVGRARTLNWNSVLVCGQPLHQLRCFISTVSMSSRIFPALRVYSAVGKSLPWKETAVHSQGTVVADRVFLLRREIENILKYHLKGDLISCADVLAYLNRRETL